MFEDNKKSIKSKWKKKRKKENSAIIGAPVKIEARL